MAAPFDIPADLETPASVFMKLRPLRPRCLLESLGSGGAYASRYSFIVFGECTEFKLTPRGLRVGDHWRKRPASSAELLCAMRDALAALPRLHPTLPAVPLQGGLIGVAGYDLARYFEPSPARADQDPDHAEAHYLAPRSLLVFDHATQHLALLHAGTEGERLSLRREVMHALANPPSCLARVARPSRALGPAAGSLDAAGFAQRVERAQDYIAAGDAYQLVLSIQYSGRCELEPFDAYRALRLLNPSPYMFYCELGDCTVVGASPEALVRLHAGRAELRPIAGTFPRAAARSADAELEAALLADPKENAEHVMLVDLARNDLGRVALPGTIRVQPYRCVERYSHVMHLVSGVSGELEPGKDAFDLFAAAFPAGTLVGAPKVRAMQIIDELEPVPRGFYGGAVGYFSVGSGSACMSMDHAIAIRTLVFRGDTYTFQAGAGVVVDSVPLREYAEVLAKSEVLRRALAHVQEGL